MSWTYKPYVIWIYDSLIVLLASQIFNMTLKFLLLPIFITIRRITSHLVNIC